MLEIERGRAWWHKTNTITRMKKASFDKVQLYIVFKSCATLENSFIKHKLYKSSERYTDVMIWLGTCNLTIKQFKELKLIWKTLLRIYTGSVVLRSFGYYQKKKQYKQKKYFWTAFIIPMLDGMNAKCHNNPELLFDGTMSWLKL